MRKMMILLWAVMLAMSAYGKGDVTEIDRDCTLSGGVFALCKSAVVSPKDATMFPEGTKWFLENKRIGKDNFISFWIEEKDGVKKEFNYWKEHDVAIYIIKGKNGDKSYSIRDDAFHYLSMIEVQKDVFLIQLFTKEL